MDQEQLNQDMLSALHLDPLYIAHLDNPKPNWSISTDGFLRHHDRIYIPNSDDLRLRVLRNKHDHILSGHPGQNKTTELILRDYTWPGIQEFVKTYCKSCTSCMCAKPQRHKLYGLLKQLPVPECPWNSISMDFIEPFPASFDSILVIIDHLMKQAIFIPTTIYCTSEDHAMLFVIHVFSKHRVSKHVTSNR